MLRAGRAAGSTTTISRLTRDRSSSCSRTTAATSSGASCGIMSTSGGVSSAPASRAAGCKNILKVAALLLAACTAGCGPPTASHRSVTVWAMGREGEVIAKLLPEFQRLHPDIEVRVQQLPWNTAHQKLLTAFAGGATPDLCQLGNSWIPEFAALEALEPLETSVAGSSVVQSADYFPGIWQTNLVEGRLYGVPWYIDTRLLFYRRDLLAQAGFSSPPRTWS